MVLGMHAFLPCPQHRTKLVVRAHGELPEDWASQSPWESGWKLVPQDHSGQKGSGSSRESGQGAGSQSSAERQGWCA